METEQISPQQSLGQGRNKEIKDFPEFNENEGTYIPKLMGHYERSAKWKVHSTKYSHTNKLKVHLKALENKKKQTHPGGIESRK